MGVINYEDTDRRICEIDRGINSSDTRVGKEGYDPSDPIAIRAAIIQRAELERSRRSELDKSERYGYIYLTENLINHKIYVGKKKSNIYVCDYIGSGILLWKSVEKYGKENFSNKVLFWCYSEDDLNDSEFEMIALLKGLDPYKLCSYNIADGGKGGDTFHCLSIERQEEIKRIISEKNSNPPAERVERIRSANIGKVMSEESRQKWLNSVDIKKFGQAVRDGQYRKLDNDIEYYEILAERFCDLCEYNKKKSVRNKYL